MGKILRERGYQWAGATLAFVVAAAMLSACASQSGDQSNEGVQQVSARAGPRERVEAVNLDGIHSGDLEVTGNLLDPTKHEEVWMRVDAKFRRLGEGGFPRGSVSADAENRVASGSVDFNSSLTLLPKFGVAVYGHAFHEHAYEFGHSTAEAVQTKLQEAQEDGGDGALVACVEAAERIDLSKLLENVKDERPRELSRQTALFAVIAEINLPRLASALIELAEDPRCGAQLRAMGIPPASELKIVEARVEKQIERTKIKIGLDRYGVPRFIEAVAVFESPSGFVPTFTFRWALSQINQVGPFLPSPGTRPFGALLRKFGTSTQAVLHASPEELVLGFLTGVAGGLTGRLP